MRGILKTVALMAMKRITSHSLRVYLLSRLVAQNNQAYYSVEQMTNQLLPLVVEVYCFLSEAADRKKCFTLIGSMKLLVMRFE
jgi:hypothetical protein